MLNLSVGIVALNEEKYLPGLFQDLINQTYNHSNIELLLIDSGSSDLTKKIMIDFKNKNSGDFKNILVIDNPKRIQSAGWNLAIRFFTGDSLTRIDAHARIDKNFCKHVAEALDGGEYVVGGKRPNLIEKETKWTNTLLQLEKSLFGSGILKSRSSDKKQYVKTMFHATYKREVIEKVGMFNEDLLRTEDNEYHYRVKKAGFRLYYDPRIISFQYTRNDFGKMVKQKFGNGYWVGKTFKICPACLSMYHFAPLFFFFSIIITIILSIFGLWYFIVSLLGIYFLFAIINTIFSGINNRFYYYHLLMPFLFFILHFSYGLGTFVGLLSFNHN